MQHCRDLGRDLDAAAGEAHDDHVVGRLTDHAPAYELQGEEPSGLAPVAKAGRRMARSKLRVHHLDGRSSDLLGHRVFR
jgi:hypothetical protein